MFPFLLIHDKVCLMQNFVYGNSAVLFRNFHQSEAEALGIGMSLFTAKNRLYAFQLLAGFFLRTVSKDNTEFVTTDTGKYVLFTDMKPYCICKITDVPVSFYMSKCIIYLLQVVQVTVTKFLVSCLRYLFSCSTFAWKRQTRSPVAQQSTSTAV